MTLFVWRGDVEPGLTSGHLLRLYGRSIEGEELSKVVFCWPRLLCRSHSSESPVVPSSNRGSLGSSIVFMTFLREGYVGDELIDVNER